LQIISVFGKNICSEENKIDNKKLAAIVFNDTDALKELNKIIHPAVGKHFTNWCKKQSGKYVIKEAAILFESGADSDMDFIATVLAPFKERINWVKKRDHLSEESIIKRMKNQISDEEKIKRSQFVIQNNNIELLLPQVLQIHNTLSELKK
jgi:dephospho-CoA kinase